MEEKKTHKSDYEICVCVTNKDGIPRSSVWNIWCSRDDIYLSTQGLKPIYKTSLHASGKFRHAFVDYEQSVKYQGPGKDRATQKWIRPIQQNSHGTWLFQVIILGAGLSQSDIGGSSDHAIRLPSFDQHDTGYISLLELEEELSGKPIQFGNIPGAVIGHHQLKRGTHLYVVWHVHPLSPDQMPTVIGIPKMIRQEYSKRNFKAKSSHRSFLVIESVDRIGRLMDFGIKEMLSWDKRRLTSK